MPNPMPPGPMQGLKQAAPPPPQASADGIDQLVAQRQGINSAVGGGLPPSPGGAQVDMPMMPSHGGGFNFHQTPPDIAGLASAMHGAGMQGSRTENIDLDSQPEMGFDELMRRAQAIPGGR